LATFFPKYYNSHEHKWIINSCIGANFIVGLKNYKKSHTHTHLSLRTSHSNHIESNSIYQLGNVIESKKGLAYTKVVNQLIKQKKPYVLCKKFA